MAVFQPLEVVLKEGKGCALRGLCSSDVDLYVSFRNTIARETSFTLQRPDDETPIEEISSRLRRKAEHPRELIIGAFMPERLVGIVAEKR